MVLRFILLGCDHLDCAAESEAEPYLTDTRRRARKDGWHSGPAGDFCPEHAAEHVERA